MISKLYKEKYEYLMQKFKTPEGWFHIFVGGAIWGLLIYELAIPVKDFIYIKLSFLNCQPVQWYLSFVIFSIVTAWFGLGITFVLAKIYRLIFKKT